MATQLRMIRTWKSNSNLSLMKICTVSGQKRKMKMLNHYSTGISDRPTSNLDYCMNLVKQYDFENFLCAMLCPKSIRTTVLAIHAFNVEIARVADIVSDKQTGIMRMQFWKDSIEKVYKDNPPKSPVVLELARAIDKHNLNKRWFLRIIEARAKQFDVTSTKTMEEALEYAEQTVSSVLYLMLESLNIKNVQVDHAASHLGKAKGMVTLLRGIPHNAVRQRVMIPQDILIKHNVSTESILRGKQDKPVLDVIYDIACEANKHINIARSMKAEVPKSAMPVFLNSVICDKYLEKIQSVNFNVFDSKLQQKNGLLPLQLLLQKIKRTY